jgi:prepilin-type processing-associated H-X9-DG protein
LYGKRGFGAWADGASYFQAHGHRPDGRNWPGHCTVNCTNDDAVYSFHSGGAQFLFADGSVKFLSEDLDLFVLFAIFTRANGEVLSPTGF